MFNKLFFRPAIVFCLLINFHQVSAQEVLYPLSGNPVIRRYLKEHPVDVAAWRIQMNGDTLSLPFLDDFSRQGIYPFDSLWNDSDAFINSTFCDQPVTLGVATLDGLNKFGNPYNEFATFSDSADFLTSKPIDLHFPGNNSIWFSFFYQPQGLGDEPELDDSLSLQFLSAPGTWDFVWSAQGRSDTAFKRVNIHITDSTYQYRGFQFRFLNYATINGNRDHWNIDYVWLDKDRSENDSIRDISLVNSISSYISEFSAMPYAHFRHLRNLGIVPLKSTIRDTVRFFKFNGSPSATVTDSVVDETGSLRFNNFFQPIAFPASLFSDSSVSIAIPDTIFDHHAGPGFADFIIQHKVSSSADAIPSNNSSLHTQNFRNYYAYDDGTAEWAYGIPEAGAKIAYRFDVKMQDTLRGVQIYFNQVGDVIHNKLFSLCLWSDVDVNNNTEQLVYKMINQKPVNIDSINGFATYLFDTLLIVPAGPLYVGWIQGQDPHLDAVFLDIGLDRNTVSTNNMFAYYLSHWHQSQIMGSWMMRPVFGDTVTVPIGIEELVTPSFSFDVYPSPATESFSIAVRFDTRSSFGYQLFNNIGEIILSGPVSSGSINLTGVANGFYFVRVTDKKTKESVTRKLVVQHE